MVIYILLLMDKTFPNIHITKIFIMVCAELANC